MLCKSDLSNVVICLARNVGGGLFRKFVSVLMKVWVVENWHEQVCCSSCYEY